MATKVMTIEEVVAELKRRKAEGHERVEDVPFLAEMVKTYVYESMPVILGYMNADPMCVNHFVMEFRYAENPDDGLYVIVQRKGKKLPTNLDVEKV